MNAIEAVVETLPAALPFAVDVMIRATIVLAIVLLAVVALRGASASARHFVLSLGMVALVALPFLMVALPDARLEVLPPAAKGAADAGSAVAVPSPFPSWKTGGEESDAGPGIAEAVAAAASLADGRAARAVSGLAWLGVNWKGVVLATAIAAIPLLLLGRVLFGIFALGAIARRAELVTDAAMMRSLARAKERLGVTRATELLVSDEIGVPVVWGVARTTLILPVDALEWSRERLRVVLLHEMAHVRRLDVLSLFVGRIATALYWFHPLAWLAERGARRECERACDDLVLENGARASDYAHHLLGIASGEDLAEGYASVSLAMARPSELEGRLIAILRAGGARQPVSRRFAIATAFVLALALLPIATVRLAAKPVVEPAPVAAEIEAAPVSKVVVEPKVETVEKITFTELVENVVEEVQIAGVELVGNGHRRLKQLMPGATEYDLGMEMHGRDRYDEARAAFEKAIELGYKPDSSAYNIACGYALRGDASNAIRWLDDAVARGYDDVDHLEADSDLDPIRSDARFRGLVRDLRAKQGYRGAGRDRVTEARERVDGLRMNRSPNADEWADAGTELLRLRELDPSIDAFNEAIRLNPENWLPRYNLGCALSIKGDHPAALDALEGAILAGFEGREKLENDPDLKSVRADARFAELLKLNDALALWIGGKEKKHVEKREVFREAIPRFEEAVRLYPKSGRAWFNLGFASLSNRDFNTARDSFQRSLSLGYRGGTTMYNLACVEALAGNRDAAFEWLQKAESTGFNLSHMKGDDDLDSLRDDPRFDEMLERAWRQEEAKERIKERRKETSKRVEFGRAGGWDAI